MYSERKVVAAKVNRIGSHDLQVVGEPAKGLAVALTLLDAAHEELHGSGLKLVARNECLSSGASVQPEDGPDLVLAARAMLVDLVAEDENGAVDELLVGQDRLELVGRLVQPLPVPHVHEEDDGVDRREVVFPHAAHLRVSTQVERGEVDVAERELFRRRMQRGHMLRQLVVFEHVQQCRLTGVIEAQEDELAGLLGQAQIVEHAG